MKECKACGGSVDDDNLNYCPLCDDVLIRIDPNHKQKRRAFKRMPLEEDWEDASF